MKTSKILKRLLTITPVLVTPLLAASCNGSGSHLKKSSAITPSTTLASYYVKNLGSHLKTQLDSIVTMVEDAAKNGVDLNITSQIGKAISDAKKQATTDKRDPSEIDKITFKFTNSSNIMVTKISNKYILTAFPSFIQNQLSSSLSTTLSLTISADNKATSSIVNNYEIAKSFKNYTAGLVDPYVNSFYASADGSTIYASTADITPGFTIGRRNVKGVYTFTQYRTSLANIPVNAIYASPDGSTVYLGTTGSAVVVGTKTSSGAFTWKGYADQFTSLTVSSIYVSADGNTIYAGTANGFELGTKQSGGMYKFTSITAGISNPRIEGISVSADGSTIYAGTESGLSIGTKQPDGTYTFTTPPVTGLGDSVAYSVSVSDNGTIFVGMEDGLYVGKKTGDKYSFVRSNTESAVPTFSVYVTKDGSSVYQATAGEGVWIGNKKSGASKYEYTQYKKGLGSVDVNGIYCLSNGSGIFAATSGGISLTLKNWFSS